jgi:hypothetical protein
MNKKFWIKKIIGFSLLGILAVALLGYTVMFLWNHVLVTVISVSVINFWQAMGILVLSKILFGGFNSRSRCSNCKSGHWKNEMKEKWQGMSEEERDKIKEEWRNRCRIWKKAEAE